MIGGSLLPGFVHKYPTPKDTLKALRCINCPKKSPPQLPPTLQNPPILSALPKHTVSTNYYIYRPIEPRMQSGGLYDKMQTDNYRGISFQCKKYVLIFAVNFWAKYDFFYAISPQTWGFKTDYFRKGNYLISSRSLSTL